MYKICFLRIIIIYFNIYWKLIIVIFVDTKNKTGWQQLLLLVCICVILGLTIRLHTGSDSRPWQPCPQYHQQHSAAQRDSILETLILSSTDQTLFPLLSHQESHSYTTSEPRYSVLWWYSVIDISWKAWKFKLLKMQYDNLWFKLLPRLNIQASTDHNTRNHNNLLFLFIYSFLHRQNISYYRPLSAACCIILYYTPQCTSNRIALSTRY